MGLNGRRPSFVAPGSLVVVSFDPGVATGWSIIRVPAELLVALGMVQSIRHMKSRCGEFVGGSVSASVDRALELCRQTYDKLCEPGDGFAIVTEGFTLRMMSMDPSLLEPVRFNAILHDRLRGTGMGAVEQSPSDAKKSVSDERLKLWGLWRPGPDHMRDGLRHGLLFCRRYASIPAVREMVGVIEAEEDEYSD